MKQSQSLPILLMLAIVLSTISCSSDRRQKRIDKEPQNIAESTKMKEPENIEKDGWKSLFDGQSLSGWEVTEFGTGGPVIVSEKNIVLGMGDGCTGITLTNDFPKMNYELSLEAKKVSGNDFFCGLTFPIDSSYCSLIIGGWGGPVMGLSCIDGIDASDNETTILKKFDHDVWYHINLKVTQNKIEVLIDEEELINFNTTGHTLSIRPEVSLSRPLGICSWMTTAAIRNIKFKKID